MLLKHLCDLHDRIADRLAPEYHQERGCRWIIDLDSEGRFLGLVDTTGEDKKPKLFTVPYRRRSGSRPAPYLLADTPAYTLALGLEKMDDAKAAERHDDYVALAEACISRCTEPALQAVAAFLSSSVQLDEARASATDKGMAPGDILLFRVGDEIVTNLPTVRRFWQERQSDASTGDDALRGECMVCAEQKPILQRHPVEMRLGRERVQLITANDDAFESFGLEASEIAPVCADCALRYGAAARHLMTTREHHYSVGNVHYLYWTRSGSGGGIFDLLQQPQPEQVRELLRSPFTAKVVGAPEEAFYAVSVSSNTSRLVIRDWIETTVGDVKAHLARYFALQQLAGPWGEPPEPLGLYALAGSLVRKMDDLPPQVLPALIRCALQGTPLPSYLLHQCLRRAQADADNRVTRPRAALLKMVLNSNPTTFGRELTVTEQLDLTNTEPAYLCGRLMRLLEEAQEAAIPGAGATIMDRFFATASTAPASVFGRLMRGAQNHLGKLRRDRPAVHHALQNRIEEVTSELPGFPTVLDLTQQGLFVLGYYHQRAADRAAMTQAVEAKKAAAEADHNHDVDSEPKEEA